HRNRVFHYRFDRVQAHALVANGTSFGNDLFRQRSAQPLAPKLRAQVKALHLTNLRLQAMQGYASGKSAVVLCEQQTAIGRGVVSRKADEFLIETLEAQAEAKRLCVFEKELACLSDVVCRFYLHQGKTSNHRVRGGRRGN